MKEYDATYQFGNTTVHIVAPPPMTNKEIHKILEQYYNAGWMILQELKEPKKH